MAPFGLISLLKEARILRRMGVIFSAGRASGEME